MADDMEPYIRGPHASIGVSQSYLIEILNTISDIVFTVLLDERGEFRFAMVNRRFLEATGLSPDRVFGQRVVDVIPEPSRNMVVEKYRQAIATRRPVVWEERSAYPAGTKLGHVTIVALFNSDGGFSQIVGWVHDVTECERRAALVNREG
jgi:PAS domain S-box-containing protein